MIDHGVLYRRSRGVAQVYVPVARAVASSWAKGQQPVVP